MDILNFIKNKHQQNKAPIVYNLESTLKLLSSYLEDLNEAYLSDLQQGRAHNIEFYKDGVKRTKTDHNIILQEMATINEVIKSLEAAIESLQHATISNTTDASTAPKSDEMDINQ